MMDENFEDMANTAEAYYQRQENWRAGYDVSTEGALGDYPEDCGW